MKMAIRIVLVLVILLIVAVAGVFYYIDSIAKNRIEVGATHALGVETTLGGADISVFRGEFAMNKLNVNNPDGYKSKRFVGLGDGKVAVRIGSLMEDMIDLPLLHLTDMDITLEKGADGKTNADVIMAHLNEVMGGDREPAPANEDAKRYVIREVLVRNVTLNVAMAPMGTADKPFKVVVPEIRLKDVGSDSDKGVLMEELTGIILTATFKAVIQNAGDVLDAVIINSLNGSLSQVADLANVGIQVVGDVTGKAAEVAGEVGKTVGEIGEKVGGEAGKTIKDTSEKIEGVGKELEKGIGNLLGGKKDDQPKDEETTNE